MKNRRRDRRIQLPAKMDATITYSDALKKVAGGLIGDISTNGMFMVTEAVLDKDAYVTMRLNSENLIGKPVYLQGLVVRTDDRGMAIKFTYANDDDITTLLSF
ncbi:MAG TPA: PilZ domain-containing protein [Desulfomonilia bacterium]|nr:PilZ domain-containing protein [Desulfomonilia bacterium]